jgi:hypothetical protein
MHLLSLGLWSTKMMFLSTLEHESITSTKGDDVPYDTRKTNRQHGIDAIKKRLEKIKNPGF